MSAEQYEKACTLIHHLEEAAIEAKGIVQVMDNSGILAINQHLTPLSDRLAAAEKLVDKLLENS